MNSATSRSRQPAVRIFDRPSRWAVRLTVGYVGLVALLAGIALLTEDSAGSLSAGLYVGAVVLTFPVGVFFYPALYVNLLVVGAVSSLFGLGPAATDLVAGVGLVTVFAIAASLNSVLVRYVGRTALQARKGRPPSS